MNIFPSQKKKKKKKRSHNGQRASLMLAGIPCLCSLHERSLAALLLDLVALKLLGQKQGFITRLLVA